MIRGLYTAASGMSTQMKKQEIISNNLANADTAGYKKDTLLVSPFREMLINRIGDVQDHGQSPLLGSINLGSCIDGMTTDFSSGAMVPTQRSLDFALEGRGFFVVDTPTGIKYTRSGGFNISSEGNLVTSEGYAVIGENGAIRLEDENAAFGRGGEVIQGGAITNKMLVVDIAAGDLLKAGDSLFALDEGGELLPALDYRVQQGYIEKSNVNVVKEMVNMITGMRTYEANQRVLGMQSESLGKLISQGLG
jgi:flagellar basal-body rod protein FlgF